MDGTAFARIYSSRVASAVDSFLYNFAQVYESSRKKVL